jgi:hypothetical protein
VSASAVFDMDNASLQQQADFTLALGADILAVIDRPEQQDGRAAAEAAAAVLRRYATLLGQDADIEVAVYPPGHFSEGAWVACWEAGPSDWGVPVSLYLTVSKGRLVETFYGVDLLFYTKE